VTHFNKMSLSILARSLLKRTDFCIVFYVINILCLRAFKVAHRTQLVRRALIEEPPPASHVHAQIFTCKVHKILVCLKGQCHRIVIGIGHEQTESLEAAGVEGLKKPRSELLELSPALPVSSPSA
jgi:hypothetical protein